MEQDAVRFFVYDLEALLDDAMAALGAFIGAPACDLVPISNATAGVNAVLRSLDLAPGEELLTTNHEYNACGNVLAFVAQRAGARVVVADIPFPIDNDDQVIEPILRAVSSRTRLALISHVTSPTAVVFPIGRIIAALAARNVPTLVDGAHAPGMIELDIRSLAPAYYTGNCHKWICAPKGAGFLYVRPDLQPAVRPAVISHGANATRTDRSRYLLEFGWMGTDDPTPILCVPRAIEVMGAMLPGGWAALRAHNHDLACSAHASVCRALGVPPAVPDAMLGSMASIPLPPARIAAPPTSALYADPLQGHLASAHRVQAPVVPWPAPPRRLVRLSAQIYNTQAQYDHLGEALVRVLRDELGVTPS